MLNHSSGSTNLVNVNEERNEIFINIPGLNHTVVAELEVKRDFNLAVYMLKKSRLPVSDSIPCAFSTSSMTPPTQLDFQTASTFGPRLSSITPLPQTLTPSSQHPFGHQQQASFTELLTSPLPFFGSDNTSTSQCQTPQRLQSLPTYVPASTASTFSHNVASQPLNPYHLFSGLSQAHTPRVGSPLKQLFHPGESASPPSTLHLTPTAQTYRPHIIHHKPNSPLSQASAKAFVADARREDLVQTFQGGDNSQQQDVTEIPGEAMQGLELFQDDAMGDFRHLMPRPRKLPFDSQPRRSASATEPASNISTQHLNKMTLRQKGSRNQSKEAFATRIPTKVAAHVPNRASSRPDPIRTPIRASIRKNSPKGSSRGSKGRSSTKALIQVSEGPNMATSSTEEYIRKSSSKTPQQRSKGKTSTKIPARASTATKTEATSAQASDRKSSPKTAKGSKGKASTKTSTRASAVTGTEAASTVPTTKKSSPKPSQRGSTRKASPKTSVRASRVTNTKVASAVPTSKKGSPKTPQRASTGKTSPKTSTQASRITKPKATSALPTTKKTSPKTPQRVSARKNSTKASTRTSTGINAAATPIGAPTRAKPTPKTSTRAQPKAKSESNKKATPKARRETPKSSTKAEEARAEFASGGEQHAKSIPNVSDKNPSTPTTDSTASTLSESKVACATPSVKVPVNETTMVFLTDGKALQDVNRLTSTLFDQYNSDMADGQEATMLASFYMERVMKARRDFWLGKLTDASGQISMLR